MSNEKKTYLVVTGLDYEVKGKAKRAEPDDLVDDLPPKSVKWLLEQGLIVDPDAADADEED